MSDEIRLLGRGDRDALDQLLADSPDVTMFFRSNLARAGMDYTGADFSAQYVGACRGQHIRAVAAHCWNGILLMHEPGEQAQLMPDLARAAVAISGRVVAGLIGGWAEVVAARAALGFTGRPTNMTNREILYGLDLAQLRVPALLKNADGDTGVDTGVATGVQWRPAEDRDVERLVAYRVAYHKEALGSPDSPDLPARCRADVVRAMGDSAFVLVSRPDGDVLSCSFFNARVPDTVQIGGVFTPPAERGRGYARAVVAGSLIAAREQGVARSILFTGRDNPAAQAAYRALGYQAIGDYGLVLFGE